MRLDDAFEDFVECVPVRRRRRQAQIVEDFARSGRVEHALASVLAVAVTRHGFEVFDARKRPRERDAFASREADRAAVGGDRNEMRDQRLVELHHVGDVPIRRVELEHRELGIVRRVDAFVAEDAPDLVDALDPADDQPLEVELGRDAHAHELVERVAMRHERARRRAAGDVQQRRRFDLVEAAIVDEAAHLGDQAAAGHHVSRARRG